MSAAERLGNAPFFSELSEEDRRRLAPFAVESRVAPGKVLVEEGDLSYDWMVVQEGEAEVTRDGEHVADVGPGELIGEMGVLGDEARNATVTAKTDMTLITLSRWDVRRLAKAHAEVVDRLRETAVRRR